MTCHIQSTETQHLICSFTPKLCIRLGISSEHDFLWDFQFLLAENTTRKDSPYVRQSQKCQRCAELNKWNTPECLVHRKLFRIQIHVSRSTVPLQPGPSDWRISLLVRQCLKSRDLLALNRSCLAEFGAIRAPQNSPFLRNWRKKPQIKTEVRSTCY